MYEKRETWQAKRTQGKSMNNQQENLWSIQALFILGYVGLGGDLRKNPGPKCGWALNRALGAKRSRRGVKKQKINHLNPNLRH